MINKHFVSLFYFGTLISSVGTFAFNLALIAYMLKNGFNLAQASLIIGLQRFIPVVVTGIWGHYTDHWSAKVTVIIAEVIAAITSIALLLIWSDADTNYNLLAIACVMRSVVVSFQMGSRAKITKLLSDNTYSNNSKHAIWMNKATQGATLFGGLFAWVIIRYFNLETAIIFDAITFILNGVIVLLLPNLEAEKASTFEKISWYQKFSDLFRYNKRAAVLDILLATSMMGTVAYMSRLAGNDQSWAGLYMGSYGLAVWVSGFLERGITTRASTIPYWFVLGFSFLVLGQLTGPSVITLAVFFVKDLSFWTIFHRISSHIQVDTPAERIGSVISARTSIMITILALGEIMVGAWSNVAPITLESSVRALLSILVGGYLLLIGTRKVSLNDRPEL